MTRRRQCLLVCLLFFACGVSALAQTPVQVKDANTTHTGGTWMWPYTADFVEMGGAVYFQVSDGVHGIELWRSDGSEGGTRLVRDICPGACSSAPRWPVAVGSMLYFAADDGAHGLELWKSDGTAAGTEMVADFTPGLGSSGIQPLFELNGLLYLSRHLDGTGNELWVSNGTAAGTVLVKDIWPGPSSSYPRPWSRLGGFVFLNAEDGDHGRELWRTDGTEAGTVLVKDIQPGTGSSLDDWANWPYLPGYSPYVVASGRLLFSASDGASGNELWASDGTPAGTVLVKDIDPGSIGSVPAAFIELGGQAVFRAVETSGAGNELWKSDGTTDGTVRVKDIRPGSQGSSPHELTVLGGWGYFRADDGTHGWELWRTDGTEANTTLIKDIQPGSASGLPVFSLAGLAAVGTRLVFFADDGAHGHEAWTSDGTEAGTTLLADINPGPGASQYALFGIITDRRAVSGGLWWFRAYDDEADAEVYVSDGTPAGTRQLAEINDQASGFDVTYVGLLFGANPMADANGTLFFQASDGPSGTELWKSDGSAAGTGPVADLFPGPTGSAPFEITALGDRVLFSADVSGDRELWISDGSAAGTAVLKDLEPTGSTSGGWPWWLTRAGDHVYFTGDTASGGLWQSDGTEEGTVLVEPPAAAASELTAVGSVLFYSGSGPDGAELWKTDGTVAGTVQVKNIAPGSASSSPDRITRVGDRVFFSADDGASGRELWVSDGTEDGTFRVKDIATGGASGIAVTGDDLAFRNEHWAAAGPRVFFVADGGTTGEELWMSDGTEEGTVLVQDIHYGSRSSEIRQLTTAGNFVYFVADNGAHGREPWVSDGTWAGTRMLGDLVPGEGSSAPDQLVAVGRNLVFSAHSPDHGREPWITDGSLAGTRRLADIAPGATPSSPQSFTLSGPSLYFAATDGETGFELYSFPRTALDGGLDFYTVTPCRLFDTRTSYGALESGTLKQFPVAGTCGIPESAQALVVNVTALGATSRGNVLLHRAGMDVSGSSTLNFGPGEIRSNNTVVQLGWGAFEGMATLQDDGQVHLIVDVTGYYE